MKITLTYRRNQVEETLWLYGRGYSHATDPDPVFRTRIKRLLELDSQMGQELRGLAEIRFAFSDEMPGGKGVDLVFTEFNTFALSIGLDLLDAGFKQKEIVTYLRLIRSDLALKHRLMVGNPLVPGKKIPSAERPGCPSVGDINGRYADCHVYLLIERVELTETMPAYRHGRAIFISPVFCHGRAQLAKGLDRLNQKMRKVLVVELALRAVLLRKFLTESVAVRRGRPGS
jgi:hypothetical protein